MVYRVDDQPLTFRVEDYPPCLYAIANEILPKILVDRAGAVQFPIYPALDGLI